MQLPLPQRTLSFKLDRTYSQDLGNGYPTRESHSLHSIRLFSCEWLRGPPSTTKRCLQQQLRVLPHHPHNPPRYLQTTQHPALKAAIELPAQLQSILSPTHQKSFRYVNLSSASNSAISRPAVRAPFSASYTPHPHFKMLSTQSSNFSTKTCTSRASHLHAP
jgi:hypothetical protein